MEKYFAFNTKALAAFGLHLEKNDSKIAVILKHLSVGIVFLLMFQIIMYLNTGENFDLEVAKAIIMGLFDLQGCFKIVAVILNQGKLRDIKKRLRELVDGIKKDQLVKHNEAFDRYRLITTTIVTSNFVGIWLFNLTPAVLIVYFYFVNGTVVKLFPFTMWYPFDKLHNFFITYCFDVYTAHTFTVLPHVLDGLIMLFIGQLVVLLRRLGDDFVDGVNNFKSSEAKESGEKIKLLIERHNELLDLCEELFHIYEIPLLVDVLTQSGTLCFVGFIMAVRLNN